MKFFIVLVSVLALFAPAWGKTFTRCSLARELYDLGVPKSDLARWTCIAERESAYRTDAVGPRNSDGSHDYGIFQINDLYWCQPSNGKFSHNECHVNCDALLSNDIRRSLRCALQVKRQQGWEAWTTWKYCSGNLPSINDCF